MKKLLPHKWLFIFLPLIAGLGSSSQVDAQSWTFRFDLDGQEVVGTSLFNSAEKVLVLGVDGQIWEFAPSEAESYAKVADGFTPLSQSQVRGELLREFGNQFEVTGTGHYLVVHPPGQRDRWANRFEELHRSFQGYFTSRGFRVAPAQFPLVAVVFPTFAEYAKHSAKLGVRVTPGMVGYYSGRTNRVLMYDISAGQEDDAFWEENAATMVHEATHQTAFNAGIHSRTAIQPKWVVEGLATMFEAPGVWNSAVYRRASDRINRGRLDWFQDYAAKSRPSGSLKSLIESDKIFGKRPDIAYSESWAVCFYLVETDPRNFARYLSTVAARPPGSDYSAAQRIADFESAFGSNWEMLEARFLRYIQGLK
ncbi:DUF1570 domain-containing protein [Blastopirellula sp. JC732]|uniref:DUF1570 domain-containing protein n=1 Tax=Blastopirellula sediminis TaxID=2894196 RepID=A0A9X1MQJ0_9BACT|nr:DUF1570 domain-containing protein [Blastopirellula sediminis]MCC9606941.1 DUF1570 domain-containing protein [Blastopirellula sediminis]MCC9629764.1 DUF1570 domain-containing protein [Blastopirellula sediminis]